MFPKVNIGTAYARRPNVDEAVARSNLRDFTFDEVEIVVCVRLHSVVDGLFLKDVHGA